MMQAYRLESDLIGEKQVPKDAYYGVQTQRALDNFDFSKHKLFNYPDFIKALAIVKKAAAATNHDLKELDESIYQAIAKACDQLLTGKFDKEFPIDLYQGGAGTSTNMNANEVIANVALEQLGFEKGDYKHCSPNDHVNLSQSTNDAYPTALKLAIWEMNKGLCANLYKLENSLNAKADAFKDVIKMGRTQLQDAVPMTLGQEFSGFAHLIKVAQKDLHYSATSLLEVNMGATAIGTGINAPKGFDTVCAAHLASLINAPVVATEHLVAATSDTSCFVEYSSALKKLCLKLTKICNDLRLLSSGPRTGIFEINLPQKQPGSSIMPGKVNPVIPEVVNQICYKVIGNDLTVTLASENAQLQLNVMEPVITVSIFESIDLLQKAIITLIDECIDGITANVEHCKQLVQNSVGIVTALNPHIGYKKSTEIAKIALATNRSVYDIVLEQGLLTKAQLDEILDAKNMI